MLNNGIYLFLLLMPCSFGHVTIRKYDYILISIDNNEINKSPPPIKPTDHAKVARTLVHKSQWAATGTLSTNSDIKGFPMVNIISVADSGKNEPSTGHLYFYLTDLDYTAQDLKVNNKLTFMISDDEDLACTKADTDPMEPTCARVIISGEVVKMDEETSEYTKAKTAFISRHPAAKHWIPIHNFFLCTLNISNIIVLDWYGGPNRVSVEDYYNVVPEQALQLN